MVAFVSGSDLTAPTAYTMTLNNPGCVLNDLLVASFTFPQRGFNQPPPAGWTTIYRETDESVNGQHALFVKVATASEPASWTFDTSNFNRDMEYCQLSVWRNAGGQVALEANAYNPGGGSSNLSPDVTSQGAGRLLVVDAIGKQSFDQPVTPAGMTNRRYSLWDQSVGAGATGTRNVTAAFYGMRSYILKDVSLGGPRMMV